MLKSGPGGVGGDDLAGGVFRGRVLRRWLYVDDGCGWVVGRLWGVGAGLGFWRAFFFFVGRSL